MYTIAQARRTGLCSHPGNNLIEQQGNKEHAFLVRQMSDRENVDTRFAFAGAQQVANIERNAGQPIGELGRCQQVVDFHRQRGAVLLRKDGLQIHHADLRDTGILDQANELL